MSAEVLTVRLVRHAESAANAGQATADPAQIPLTDAGLHQAEVLSRSFERAPARIICSPFLRARQTARPVAERFGIAVETWPIHEFTYLSPVRCANTTVAQRRQWVEAYWRQADPHSVDGPGAESFARLIERATLALERLQSHAGAGPVLMVGHGQFMQAMRWCAGRHPEPPTPAGVRAFREMDHRQPIGNCGGYSLEWDARTWREVAQAPG